MYTFERLRKGDALRIQELYSSCFGLQRSVEAIEHKYATEPLGHGTVGFFAVSPEGETAAYYGVFPLKFNYQGKELLAAQSGDTMTAPNHRKRGLFLQLAEETYRVCESNEFSFVFGFPNQFSFKGFKKGLNWKFYGNMSRFVMETRALPLVEISSKSAVLSSILAPLIKRRIAQQKVPLTDEIVQGFKVPNSVACSIKSKAFFDYKLQNKNVFLVRLGSTYDIVKCETHLYIGEITFNERCNFTTLLRDIKRLAHRLYCKKVIFNVNQHHWLHQQLSKELKAEEGLPIGFYQIDSTLEYADFAFSGADFDTF